MEIKPTIQAAIIMAGIGLLSLWSSASAHSGRAEAALFQKRRMRVVEGWR